MLVIYHATLKSYTLEGTISRELQEKIVTFSAPATESGKENFAGKRLRLHILRALNEELKKAGQRK